MNDFLDKAKEKASELKDKAEDLAEKVKDKAEDLVEKVGDKLPDSVVCYTDSTIALPLLTAYLMVNLGLFCSTPGVALSLAIRPCIGTPSRSTIASRAA